MRKWDRIHRRDQILPSILDSVLKEVVQVGTARSFPNLFPQIRITRVGHVVENSTCFKSCVGYVYILVWTLGHFGVPVDATR